MVFVGTTPGEHLEFWAEGGNIDLPHSELRMHYADRAHTYAKRDRAPRERVVFDLDIPTLAPDRTADWTWAAYRSGRRS